MSGESSAAKPVQQQGWGVFMGTLWAAFAFVGPQFALAPLMPLIGGLTLSDNAQQFVAHAIFELAVLGIIYMVVRGYRLDWFALGLGKLRGEHIAWALFAVPVYYVLSGIVVTISNNFLPQELIEQPQELGFGTGPPSELALIFIALVLVVPFVEEVLFRGFLLRGYKRLGPIAASILVSLLFALAHGQINVAIDVFVLSLVLCFVRFKTDSLWPAILTHSFKNFVAFYLLFIIGVK